MNRETSSINDPLATSMRNLSVLETVETKLSFAENDLPITATTFDNNTGDLICALGPTALKPVIELKRCKSRLDFSGHEISAITSWDAPSPLPELACDQILSLHYFNESKSTCVVLAGGDLILAREQPQPGQERIEIVGSVDVGILAAEWSWNGSLLALVTRAGSFVLMSQQLEPVNEVALHEDDLKLSKHVSVGWGKKETQFQGKRAKALKDPTMPDSVDEGKSSPNDDGSATISWRGDGAYAAVNSVIAASRRVIRVYSAEGSLDSVSEPIDGLEFALSWRPHGNLIAGVQRALGATPKLEVVFFERNGLRHGHFDLRLSESEMTTYGTTISLFWNCDSSILAVVMSDRVQLWTMGNYHYYLKQEFRLRNPRLSWHKTDPLRLCLYNPQIKRSILLAFMIHRGSLCRPFDYGLVAVIDGKTLKLTPLKHANVPPPMAYTEMIMDENILNCAISRTCQRVAVLTRSHLYLCTLEMNQVSAKSGAILRHTRNTTMQKRDIAMSPRPTQLVIKNDDAVFLLAPANSISNPRAFCYQHTWVATQNQSSDLMTRDINIPLNTTQIITDSVQESIWFCTGKDILPLSTDSNFTTTLREIAVPTIATFAGGFDEERVAISLSKDQELFIGDTPRVSQVTSYAVIDSHLVYTTSNHLLRFVNLGSGLDLSFPDGIPEIDERCRAIERGARVVTVIPSSYAVILQMSRGNLETIYPRVMVLGGIRDHIRNLEYRKAFTVCQTHQVDLNLLYDYDSQLWQSNVERFVDELKKPSRIDEFIQKMKDEDVTKTIYREPEKKEPLGNDLHRVISPAPQLQKVNSICDALIDILQKRSAEFQQNIITALVCKRPPQIAAALMMVSSLRQMSQEEADVAVAHLCFLTDNNRLYDAALGLYDLELTLLVAQNSQRDPREYIPFLQSLQALPELRKRYTIDHHLKRHTKALASLHALSEHNELEAYMVKYQLYSEALNLYKHDQQYMRKVTRLHADFLSSQSKHAAAAVLYESLSDHEAAYPLYTLAHQWREALSCACFVPLPEDQLQSLARSLATTCAEENRDYRSAATIHLEYLKEPITAAEMLCKSSYFAEAIRILSHPSHKLADRVARIIDPMLTRKFGEIIELIADCQTQLKNQVPRIEELRTKKAEDPLAFYGGDAIAADGADIPDNVSLAPTDASTLGGQSMFTRYGGGAGGSQVSTKFAGTVASNMSRKTSKTKRREERKRARGKKGSVYEEGYLVASVGRLIDRVNGTHEEVRRLILGLKRHGFRDQAERVEEMMVAIQDACEDARQRAWPEALKENLENDSGTYAVNGEGRPGGADGVLYDSQIELDDGRKKPLPQVKIWNSSI